MTKKEKHNIYLRTWRKTDVCKDYQRKYQKEYRKNNKERVDGYFKKYRKNNREKLLKGYKIYHLKNAEKGKKYAKEYRKNNLEKCKNSNKRSYLKHKEKRLVQHKEYRKMNSDCIHKYRVKHRLEAMAILGEICIKCGFNDLRGLQIDHINGGGSKIRRIQKSNNYYKNILNEVKNGSKEYQILCANCNQIKKYTDKEYIRD